MTEPSRSDPMAKLAELGLRLPPAMAPIASYVPTVEHGGMLYISGQISFADGEVLTGRLGDDLDVDAARKAAEACGLALLAQMQAALGSLDRVERVVKLGGFVTSSPEATDQPAVINGASDLMVAVFGDAGKHARAAVGVPALPRGAAVEVDAIVAVRGA